jgi:Leucine-rich repeat (LRR) protein
VKYFNLKKGIFMSVNLISEVKLDYMYFEDPFDLELQTWVQEKKGTVEYDSRLKAAAKIKECYSSKGTILDLRDRGLTSIPKAIGNIKSLEYLNLMRNQLLSLPEAIGNLRMLRSLDLAFNQLVLLPETIGNLRSLTYLNLRDNQLASLPEAISNLRNLEFFHLDNNQLDTLTEKDCFHNLKELSGENNRLESASPRNLQPSPRMHDRMNRRPFFFSCFT